MAAADSAGVGPDSHQPGDAGGAGLLDGRQAPTPVDARWQWLSAHMAQLLNR